ncbi:UNVERIFIED_CONTAM: hypothetical protein HDU68_006651 [Siphonaria sp. JEL0065]|nr:hypothetical protein HDU68_006651 [Siphonaria sp. JEL0065]
MYSETLMLTALQINPMTATAYSEFTEFNDFLNLPHGVFHMQVAGSIDDTLFGTLSNLHSSPDDPVFYLHHGNLDRYYKYFQKLNSEIMQGNGYERGANAVREVPPGSGKWRPIKVGDMLVGLTGWTVAHGLEYDSGIMCFDEDVYSGSVEVIQFVFGGLKKRDRNGRNPISKRVKHALAKLNTVIHAAHPSNVVNSFKNKKRKSRAKKVAKFTAKQSQKMMMDHEKTSKKEAKVHAFIKDFRGKVETHLGKLYGVSSKDATNEMHALAVGHAISEYIDG